MYLASTVARGSDQFDAAHARDGFGASGRRGSKCAALPTAATAGRDAAAAAAGRPLRRRPAQHVRSRCTRRCPWDLRSEPQRQHGFGHQSRDLRSVRTVRVPAGPEHVVPSYDLRTLWVNSDAGNALTPIDAKTGRFGKPVAVADPYNLYFTPDGRFAVVMAEALHLIVFRDPHTMAVRKSVPVACSGVNHADFSADGRYFIVSCEFSGDLLKVDTVQQRVVGQIHLPKRGSMPQDVKISPDGKTWYIADMQNSGLWILRGDRFADPTFLRTGAGAHGLYVSRDSKYLYVTNRGEGTISELEFATNKLVAKWHIPGGGTPDMGGVSADGRVLWVSGRYNNVVYAISTETGKLLHKIVVGQEPHGLCIWPQPGRYSLGHTGILR